MCIWKYTRIEISSKLNTRAKTYPKPIKDRYIKPSLSLSIYLSIYLSICIPVCVSATVCPSVHPSIRLPVCVSETQARFNLPDYVPAHGMMLDVVERSSLGPQASLLLIRLAKKGFGKPILLILRNPRFSSSATTSVVMIMLPGIKPAAQAKLRHPKAANP